MSKISLPDNRIVRIDSLYLTNTYGGLVDGVPTRGLNESLVETTKKWVERNWGPGRKIHVVTPPVRPVDLPWDAHGRVGKDPPERLPAFGCRAWLTSEEMKREAHGSHAFLLWWTDSDVAEVPVGELVLKALASLKWEEIAEDYYV